MFYSHNETLFSHKVECSHAIYGKMGGNGHHIKKNRSDTESLVSLGSHMWKQQEKQLIWKYTSDYQALERVQLMDDDRIKVVGYDQCTQYVETLNGISLIFTFNIW